MTGKLPKYLINNSNNIHQSRWDYFSNIRYTNLDQCVISVRQKLYTEIRQQTGSASMNCHCNITEFFTFPPPSEIIGIWPEMAFKVSISLYNKQKCFPFKKTGFLCQIESPPFEKCICFIQLSSNYSIGKKDTQFPDLEV